MINLAELAKFTIFADDQTREGTESAKKNIHGVGDAVDFVKEKWASLGGLLSIGAFAAMVKGAIDAADEVNKLSQKVGLSVEKLQELKFAAGLADVETATLGKAIKGLSITLLEAGNASSQAAAVLKALGVDISGGVNKAILQLADSFAMLPDGELKIAAAVKIFGKAGQEMIPLLNQGSEEIRRMGEVAQRLGLIMDQETTKAAEAFNDNLRIVKASSERLAVTIVNDLSPSFVRVTGAMREAAIEGGVLKAAWVGLGGIAAEALGLNDTETRKLQDNLKRVQKDIATFGVNIDPARQKDLLAGIVTAANMVEASFMKANFQLRLTQSTLDAIGGKFDDQVARAGRQGRGVPGMPPGFEQGLRDALAGAKGDLGVDTLNAYEEAIRKLDQQIALWREKVRLGRSLTESEKELAEIEAGKYAKLAPAEQAALKRKAELWKAEQQLADASKAWLQERAKVYAVYWKEIEAIDAKIEAARLENETIGMTAAEIAELTALRLDEQRAQLVSVQGDELKIAALTIQIQRYRELAGELRRGEGLKAYQDELRRATENQVRMWDEVSSRAADFFTDLVLNGKDAFQRLKEQLKGLLADMIALFAKRWILNIAAGATGSTALAASAAGVGQGTLAGSLLSSGLNWAGTGTGALSSTVAGGAEFFGGMTGTFMGPAAPGSMAAMGSQVGAFLTNPVTLAVLAAVVVAVALRSRQGGPKEGGSFFGAYDSEGRFTGNLTVPGSDNGRFYTPNGGDPIARQVGDSVAQGFFQILGRLGGTSGGIEMGFGYDKDPRGSAQSRVTALVRGADGRTLYSSTMDAGRDDEEFNRVMSLQTKRAILAGLQGSDLPEAIAAVLNSVAVATASSEDIDNILLVGEAMKGLLDTLSPLNVDEILGNASRTAIEAWRAQGDQLTELANSTTLTVESLGQLAQATGQYRAQAAALILQFENARKVVSGGIGETLRDFKFQTLDKQGQYDFLRSEASMLAGGIGNMQDAQQIVDTVNQIRQASSQAFGMLSDEEKRAKLAEYETGLKEVQRVADERLVALRTQVKTEADAQLARQEKIVTDMAKAADRMETAANTFERGANRIAEGVTLRIDTPDGYEVGVPA